MNAVRDRIYRFSMELKQHNIRMEGLEPALALSYEDYHTLMHDLEVWEYMPFERGMLRLFGIRLFPAEPWERKRDG